MNQFKRNNHKYDKLSLILNEMWIINKYINK